MAKNRAAAALGRLGGLKGGSARMKSMSAAERSALGRRAAQKRWSKKNDDAMSQADLGRLVDRVAKEQARLQPLLPEVDPHDLNLILSRILRPVKDRRYFIRRRGDRYVR